jgi:hypothetical protein
MKERTVGILSTQIVKRTIRSGMLINSCPLPPEQVLFLAGAPEREAGLIAFERLGAKSPASPRWYGE